MADGVHLRPPVQVEPNMRDRIFAAAVESFARRGVTATSLRTVADAAGVSADLVQHHFGTKADLIAAVDEHVLQVFSEILDSEHVSARGAAPVTEVSGGFARLVHDHPDVMDYVAHALSDGDEIGNVIFDGLLRISSAQGDEFADGGLLRHDLDPRWAPINPLILRVGAIILRQHIERHIPEPFYDASQLQRWDAAVTSLIRRGQFGVDGIAGHGEHPPSTPDRSEIAGN